MRSASLAEWVVRRFTSDEKAISLMGDLVELRPQKGAVWFWLSIAGVALSLGWRSVVGGVAAFYTGMWVGPSIEQVLLGVHTQHLPDPQWWPLFRITFAVVSLLCLLFAYGIVRYGIADHVTRLALAWAGLITVAVFNWSRPLVLIGCIASALGVTVASTMKKKYRKASIVLIVSMAAGFASFLLALVIAAYYQRYVQYHYFGPHAVLGDKEFRDHPSMSWVAGCMLIGATWVTLSTSSRLHTWMNGRRPVNLEGEEQILL